MYLLGLNLSSSQGIEAAVSCTTLFSLFLVFNQAGAAEHAATTHGGPVRLASQPTSLAGTLVTPVHNAAFMLPVAAFPAAVALNGLAQPAWMLRWALPGGVGTGLGTTGARLGACVAFLGVWRLVGWTLAHLGSQFHCIARREKSTVVSTGPYNVVRHPLYSFLLVQHALCAIMFWSYVPLVGLVTSAAAFAVKMPIEESIIEADPLIGAEYKEYEKKVPSRIIPYIW
ncbi:hypothetical protein BV22DRAFT_1001005 [Leucogyrophana mollusca]|uniref:Uncharacterized protein n=1 Tax=Leucogyrophana mollusca TaxID=85980 RepID=A0ACB8C050_9AGAM|nr:hypothetical protein BV22DRAFT_1001005 [Leucogyrophana mollusca]